MRGLFTLKSKIHPKVIDRDRQGVRRCKGCISDAGVNCPFKMDFRMHVHVWTVNTEQSPLVNYLCDKLHLGNFITGVTLTCSSLLCRSTQQCKKHVSTDHFSYHPFSMFCKQRSACDNVVKHSRFG